VRSFVLAFLTLGLALPAFAGGPSLSGVWEGSYSCKTEDASGKGNLKVSESTLTIAQGTISGPLIADIDGQAYSGTTVPSASDSSEGAGAWIACGTSDATTGGLYNEIETFHYKVGVDGNGTIKKAGAYVVNAVEVGVCKGSWKRVGPFGGKLGGCAP
jgi:hypothetical protein